MQQQVIFKTFYTLLMKFIQISRLLKMVFLEHFLGSMSKQLNTNKFISNEIISHFQNFDADVKNTFFIDEKDRIYRIDSEITNEWKFKFQMVYNKLWPMAENGCDDSRRFFSL